MSRWPLLVLLVTAASTSAQSCDPDDPSGCEPQINIDPNVDLLTNPPESCMFVCNNFCPHGHETQENGCPSCKCREPQNGDVSDDVIKPLVRFARNPRKLVPPKSCNFMCRNYCPNGRELNKNGCPSCKCKQPEVEKTKRQSETLTTYSKVKRSFLPKQSCPVCRNYCQYGYQMGRFGCPNCKCKRKEAEKENASEETEDSLVEEDNAETTKETPSFLPKQSCPVCRNYCQYSYQIGTFGCPTCRCKGPDAQKDEGSEENENGLLEDEKTETTEKTPSFLPKQSCPVCRNNCPYGYQMGKFGCPNCKCKGKEVEKGEEPEKTEDGLDEAEKTETTEKTQSFLPKQSCPVCRNQCSHGYQMGEFGCSTCRCKGPEAEKDQDTKETEEDNKGETTEKPQSFQPKQSCPVCRNYCPKGFKMGNFGCPTCRCK